MPPPISLYLDFDGTITTTDSLSYIASIGEDKNPRLPEDTWDSLVASYLADLDAHKAGYTPRAEDRKTVEEELEWLESLADVERRSVERVEKSELFKGVTGLDTLRAAKLAGGWHDFFGVRAGVEKVLRPYGRVTALLRGEVVDEDMYEREGVYVTIISVNWSSMFIKWFLDAAMRERYLDISEQLIVRANEIHKNGCGKLERYFDERNRYFDEGNRYSVEKDRGIWTAGDKARVLEGQLAETGGNDGGPRTAVYVGDSTTDLACLLRVDVGICVRDEPLTSEQKSLAETLDRLGIPCRWIGEFRLDDLRGTGTPRLWWARDFTEIAESRLFR